MEVDEKENIEVKSTKLNNQNIYDFNVYIPDIFKYDYENQNIENKTEFINWKSKMRRKYGEDYRFYKCDKDKIVFIGKIFKPIDTYFSKCPTCKNEICCFCSKVIENRLLFSRYIDEFCCFKRTFFFIFFREIFYDDRQNEIILGYIIFIIPLFSCWGLFVCYCIIRHSSFR